MFTNRFAHLVLPLGTVEGVGDEAGDEGVVDTGVGDIGAVGRLRIELG